MEVTVITQNKIVAKFTYKDVEKVKFFTKYEDNLYALDLVCDFGENGMMEAFFGSGREANISPMKNVKEWDDYYWSHMPIEVKIGNEL